MVKPHWTAVQGLDANLPNSRQSRQEVEDGMQTQFQSSPDLCSIFTSSSRCNVWFDISRKILPKPLRPPEQILLTRDDSFTRVRGAKRKLLETYDDDKLPAQDLHKKMRTERREFRNIRMHFTPLPKAPAVSSVPCLYFLVPPPKSY